jgi:sialate O-acetylesterase
LQEKLHVPVGLIQAAWGGTRAEVWTSMPALSARPEYKGEVENFHKLEQDPKKAAELNDPKRHPNAPAVLYNGMIAPLHSYRIKGAIWYQGESNAGQAYAYRELFPLMIGDWRHHWIGGDFPFYFVQLAPFTPLPRQPGNSSWAELREAQALTLKAAPKTGMAVITDYGSEHDIHPTPKRPVGERLALIARAKDYGEKVEYSGPVFKGMKVEGNKAALSFDHVGAGLVARELVPTNGKKIGKDGYLAQEWRVKEGSTEGAKLIGFTICGEDKVFHPAEARIEGATVLVMCPEVAAPVAVRYGWADHPLCNLFNAAGLPASPFRTDEFPGVTAPKR